MRNETPRATIRACRPDDRNSMLAIINAAAVAYRGVIPDDRWHDPYMPADELARDIADGIRFSACVVDDEIRGVMGVQPRANVDLIRHAYVDPAWQGRGIGARLLRHLCRDTARPILIGTWRAAHWAIRFYEHAGFATVADRGAADLLRTYWTVPDRQIATSVVLASPPLSEVAIERLIADARSAQP